MTGIVVEFDKPSLIYYPGESVSGKVCINCHSVDTTKGLHILFLGECNVRCTERRQRTVRRTSGFGMDTREYDDTEYYNVSLSGREEYITLFDFPNQFVLNAGQNGFPFSFPLPWTIPCSYKGRNGQISYEIIVEIKGSLFASNNIIRREIQVVTAGDLNTIPMIMNPVAAVEQKEIGCCCSVACNCHSQSNGRPYRILYWMEDPLNFNAKLLILVALSLQYIYCNIVQCETCYAQGSTGRNSQNIVFANRLRSVDDRFTETSDLWKGTLLPIPSVPPSKLGGFSRIINVDYFVTLRLSFDIGCSSDINVSVPIVVGTIPVQPVT